MEKFVLSDFQCVTTLFLNFHGFRDGGVCWVKNNDYATEVFAKAGRSAFWADVFFTYEVTVYAGFFAH
jgi:hypothetical protein